MFDYRQGEPPEHLNTVLRSLEVCFSLGLGSCPLILLFCIRQISDPYVLRILINQAHIETQLLTNTRRDAQDILFKVRGGGSAWTLDKFSVRVFP